MVPAQAHAPAEAGHAGAAAKATNSTVSQDVPEHVLKLTVPPTDAAATPRSMTRRCCGDAGVAPQPRDGTRCRLPSRPSVVDDAYAPLAPGPRSAWHAGVAQLMPCSTFPMVVQKMPRGSAGFSPMRSRVLNWIEYESVPTPAHSMIVDVPGMEPVSAPPTPPSPHDAHVCANRAHVPAVAISPPPLSMTSVIAPSPPYAFAAFAPVAALYDAGNHAGGPMPTAGAEGVRGCGKSCSARRDGVDAQLSYLVQLERARAC